MSVETESLPRRPRPTGLSKSRITLFEQCPKRLWLSVHRPELAQEQDFVTAAFQAGHRVGELACKLIPDGYMIEAKDGLSAAVAETQILLADGWRRPLFEATFAREDVLVRVDLLLPIEGGWHLAEVKNTTSLKDYHLGDLATQLWVLEATNARVISSSIRHLDRGFVLQRKGDYTGLFADTIADELVRPRLAQRPDIIAHAREALAGSEPQRDVGAHCDEPFTCSFKAYCGRDLPAGPDWPTSLLPDAAGKKLAREWAALGVVDLTQIPLDAMTSDKLRRIHQATQTGEIHRDAEAIAAETAGWAYPRIYLDFETIQFPIPRWVGTGVFEQIPFQFSAHVEAADGEVVHHEFLSLDRSDPRRACAEALVLLPPSGAVVAWNASFERSCLLKLAATFPDLAPALLSLADRLVDLMPIARRHYYHRDMRGSWSIKAVLPTLVPELNYGGLDNVRSGTDAQAAYLEAAHPDTPEPRRIALKEALSRYCEQDSLAMLAILWRLIRPAPEV